MLLLVLFYLVRLSLTHAKNTLLEITIFSTTLLLPMDTFCVNVGVKKDIDVVNG